MRIDDFMIITDIGSTTTKGLLLKRLVNGKYAFFAQYDSWTTVEEPEENVNVGLNRVISGLAEISGIRLMDDKNRILCPYFTTSSAAGGLQMLVMALTPSDSGNAAKQAALCAGGVVHRELYFTDRISEAEKIKTMKSAYPDMILLAGGYEGGINTGVIRMAHLLNLANPLPKFMPELKIPLVYCGNSKLKPFLTEALNESFDLHFTDNVRPDREKLNLEPAKNTVHDLFKEKVMQRAPGFPKLGERTSGNIVPTPTAVEKILRLYAQKNSENIVVVDMGGSTTDIYTNIKSGFKRTVAANVGLSYSMANILESIIRRGGIGELLEYLPKSYDENSIRNYFYNKTLQPSYLPQTNSEYLLEQACAILGFQFSWQQHIQMNFCRNYEDYFDQQADQVANLIHNIWSLLKKSTTGKAYTEKIFYPEDCKSFALAEIDTIIGSGGVIAYAKSKEDQIMMLTDGFLPCGITKLAIDKPFKISHMGILSDYQPELAVELFEKNCLQDLSWVVAPYGDISAKHPVLEILYNDKKFLLKGGECCYFPQGGSFSLKTGLGIFLKHKTHHFTLTTDLPVLYDCRGRDNHFIHKSLINCNIPEFSKKNDLFHSQIPLHQTEIKPFNERTIKRELPYEGQIIVNHLQSVSASTIIGVNQHFPARHFFIDIRGILGFNKKLSKEELSANFTIKKGQIIQAGDLIWHKDYSNRQITQAELSADEGNAAFRIEGSGTKCIRSPYYAEVCNILSNGLVVLKEIRNYCFQQEVIDLGLKLDLPGYIAAEYSKLKIGDFVEQNSLVAACMQKRVVSDKCGFVKEINRSEGTITLHYDKKPLPTHAFINGFISIIDAGNSVAIKSNQTDLKGVIGFGGENFGQLAYYSPANLPEYYRDKITYHTNPVNKEDLAKASQHGWKGIIAPSMHSSDWLNFYGKELGVAITGNEEIPFTIILLHGFGNHATVMQLDDFFKSHTGKMVSLNGQTQIRAGVIRPQIMLS